MENNQLEIACVTVLKAKIKKILQLDFRLILVFELT